MLSLYVYGFFFCGAKAVYCKGINYEKSSYCSGKVLPAFHLTHDPAALHLYAQLLTVCHRGFEQIRRDKRRLAEPSAYLPLHTFS